MSVKIVNFKFVPSRFTVKPGQLIRVSNADAVAHTFTATPGSKPFGRFDTGMINPGQTVTVTAPSGSGKFAFDCTLHPFMAGSLTVTS